jgi:hypothetical protein
MHRNEVTSLRDAESFQVLMFPSRSPHVCCWLPDKGTDYVQPLAKCFAASLASQSHSLQFVHILHLRLLHKSFMYPHRKKSKDAESGDFVSHAVGSLLPVHLPGNCWSRKAFVELAKTSDETCARANLENFCVSQHSFHVSIYINLGNKFSLLAEILQDGLCLNISLKKGFEVMFHVVYDISAWSSNTNCLVLAWAVPDCSVFLPCATD